MRPLAFALLLALSAAARAEEPAAPAPPPALPAPPAQPPATDAQPSDPLAPALVRFFAAPAPERDAALQSLVALQDVRAVPVLTYVAWRDAQLSTRQRAASLLGELPSAESESAATALAWDPQLDEQVRAAAIAALARMERPGVPATLTKLATDTELPSVVRQSAVDELRRRYPALAEQLHLGPKVATSSGRALVTLVGAASGGYTLALVGALSPSNGSVGATVGALGGLVIGGAAANLLSRDTPIDDGQATYLLSAALWSVPVGWLAGTLTGGPDASCRTTSGAWNDGCTAVALGVHVAAMASAWLVKDRLSFDLSDNLEVNAAALSGLLIGLGLVQIPPPQTDSRPGVALVTVLPTAGFIAGTAFAHKLQLDRPMGALVLLAGLQGGVSAGALAVALARENGPLGVSTPSTRQDDIVLGARFLGVGAGLGGMLAASAAWHPNSSDAFLLGFSALDGDLLGAAIPLLLGGAWTDGVARSIGLAVGGPVLATAAGLSKSRLGLQIDGGDALFVALGTGFAAFQGYGWGVLADDTHTLGNDRSAGLALGITGLGGLGLLAGAQRLSLAPAHAGWLYSGAVWGGWLGGWTAYALHASSNATLGAALVGSDVGLGLSALALSPFFRVSPATAAWVSIFGVGGMTLGSMFATFVSYNSAGRTISTANVVGSVVGLGLGAYFGPKLAEGAGGDVPGAAWLPDVPLPAAGAMPVLDPSGQHVSGMGAQLLWTL